MGVEVVGWTDGGKRRVLLVGLELGLWAVSGV